MNPLTVRAIIALVSFRRELKYILYTFLGVLLLPFFAVFVVANTGIPQVSDQLVTVDPQQHTIQIHDPTGKVIATIDAKTVWPLHGVVTLEFGESDLPYQPIHTGIDISTTADKPITPFMKGTVTKVYHLNWGYGNYVVIDHDNNLTSLYAHMSRTNASVGQSVQPGDVIGYEGSTGWSTGPHMHFEVRVFGVPVNPRTFVEGNLNFNQLGVEAH